MNIHTFIEYTGRTFSKQFSSPGQPRNFSYDWIPFPLSVLLCQACHLPHGITECYLPPDTSEHTPP